jgi:hypothetical protein
MTDCSFPTTTASSVSGVRNRGGVRVVPVVVSRLRTALLHRRTMADFRPWWRGLTPHSGVLQGGRAQED